MTSGEIFGDALHWSFNGSHVLFSFIRLDSFWGFLLGALLTIGICASERVLTYGYEHRWGPARVRRSRGANALWRAWMYSVLTSLRLAYMLIAMTLHAGLIFTAVTTLAVGQFFIELRTPPPDRLFTHDYAPLEVAPLYSTPSSEDLRPFQRPRSRSKPEDIFIHPAHSNIARADAAAVQLGLAGTTERVQAARYAGAQAPAAWETGAGPGVARALLGNANAHAPKRDAQFQLVGDEDSDED